VGFCAEKVIELEGYLYLASIEKCPALNRSMHLMSWK